MATPPFTTEQLREIGLRKLGLFLIATSPPKLWRSLCSPIRHPAPTHCAGSTTRLSALFDRGQLFADDAFGIFGGQVDATH